MDESKPSHGRFILNFLGMRTGCLLWIIGITALVWWMKGRRWGLIALAITILLAFLFRVLILIDQRQINEVENSKKTSGGRFKCHVCNGSGWIRKDMYNLITCSLCNGSGWEDAPRKGPPKMREG